ncbi:MAG: amidohydrolase family protein [Armatimonadota bacterium]|nr:amidohydrolase family protein [Armatimonadota bacterium]
MNEQEHYNNVDLPFYNAEIAPVLPPQVLDFHAHTWLSEHWKETPWKTESAGAKYMVTLEQYGVEKLLANGKTIFPDRHYNAVCFGYPTPAADLEKTNDYARQAGANNGLFPLFITGRDMIPKEELERKIREEGFFGYKVFLNWYGDDYGSVRIADMIGPNEMDLANELKLIVLLHVPRSGRLADPEIQKGVRELAMTYPGAAIVLAHCGRAYLPDEMKRSIGSVRDLPNVYLDTSMVMDPTVLQLVFENIDSSRVLFATDFPVASMRGRRVYVMDHWVDIVLEGYPPSAYRVASDGIRATFMVYEIVLAIKRAGEMAGLSKEQITRVFNDNGMSLLNGVMDGRQMRRRA